MVGVHRAEAEEGAALAPKTRQAACTHLELAGDAGAMETELVACRERGLRAAGVRGPVRSAGRLVRAQDAVFSPAAAQCGTPVTSAEPISPKKNSVASRLLLEDRLKSLCCGTVSRSSAEQRPR